MRRVGKSPNSSDNRTFSGRDARRSVRRRSPAGSRRREATCGAMPQRPPPVVAARSLRRAAYCAPRDILNSRSERTCGEIPRSSHGLLLSRTRRSSPTSTLLVDLGLHEFGQLVQTLLPAEIAGFGRDHVRHAFLFDGLFRPHGNGLQGYRRRTDSV